MGEMEKKPSFEIGELSSFFTAHHLEIFVPIFIETEYLCLVWLFTQSIFLDRNNSFFNKKVYASLKISILRNVLPTIYFCNVLEV